MSWRVVVRPEVEHDVAEAAAWYDAQQVGLGRAFREGVIRACFKNGFLSQSSIAAS